MIDRPTYHPIRRGVARVCVPLLLVVLAAGCGDDDTDDTAATPLGRTCAAWDDVAGQLADLDPVGLIRGDADTASAELATIADSLQTLESSLGDLGEVVGPRLTTAREHAGELRAAFDPEQPTTVTAAQLRQEARDLSTALGALAQSFDEACRS